MTLDECKLYLIPALKSIFGEASRDNAFKLDRLLGWSLYQDFHSFEYDTRSNFLEHQKELLIALAGPHGKTLLEVYRIQKGLCEP